jgi:hypothetical protein
VLVGAQVALSVAIGASAGLLARSVHELRTVDSELDARGVVVAELYSRGVYRDVDHGTYFQPVLDGVHALPGVVAASVSGMRPLGGSAYRQQVTAVHLNT